MEQSDLYRTSSALGEESLPSSSSNYALDPQNTQSLAETNTHELTIPLWPYINQDENAKAKSQPVSDPKYSALTLGAAFGLAWCLLSIAVVKPLFVGEDLMMQMVILLFLMFSVAGLIVYTATGAIPPSLANLLISDPGYIRLYRWGLSFQWMLRGRVVREQQIYWRLLNRVSLLPAGASQQAKIRFETHDGYCLDLKLQKLSNRQDWLKFLQAAREWGEGAGIRIDESIMLSFKEDEAEASYTELWLEALNEAPERSRLLPLAPGALLKDGNYEVIRQIAAGGQGTAYLAHSSFDTEREIVLKEYILPVYVDVRARRYAIDKFTTEAAMLKSLSHPNIVKLCDFFVEDHRAYLVEEYVRGRSLREIIQQQGPAQESAVVDIAIVMTEVLSYLHSCSPPVVHRDFTPDNLLINEKGQLKVIDFTVAQKGESASVATVVGKQSYLPPEQFRGQASTQSDIYAFGGTLYFLLTGQDPEPLSQSNVSLTMPEINPMLNQLIGHCTALDLTERYHRIEQVKGELCILKRESANLS
jgi:tRNA A-37 threonylcarbamoyl transferase component Bud32